MGSEPPRCSRQLNSTYRLYGDEILTCDAQRFFGVRSDRDLASSIMEQEGGGYFISFPDFAECISDGESIDEAIENGLDALKATIAALKSRKLPVPAPNSGGVASGKFVARVPKTVHAQLATRARAEGVSLNALVLTFIAQGLGGVGKKARAKGLA